MMDQESRICQNCRQSFIIEPDDFSFYEKIQVPAPTMCPQCRMLRRFAWWGYRVLYKRKCNFTDDEVISFYHPDAPHVIYRQDIWWSDKWDPKSYGREYDFSRSFFEQFRELFSIVPLPSLHTEYTTLINSEYCNAAALLKNCYLCFKSDRGENGGYTNTMTGMKDSFDITYSNNVELCYEVTNVDKCYRVFYSQDIEDSHDVYFSRDLIGCSFCIGCINLRNKNYYIFNKPYSKEEFEKKLQEFNFGSVKGVFEFQQRFREFALQYPRKAFHGRKNMNVSGDYIFNSKNVRDSYMVAGGENLRYCQLLRNQSNAESYDHTGFGSQTELMYETVWAGLSVSKLKFCFWNYHANDLEYCIGCHGSNNLFGCIGIRNGSYCIFNKQYSKEEYVVLVEKIKKQMLEVPFIDKMGNSYRYGEFFPLEFCPWAYNETHAYEFFPKPKEKATAQGFLWRDVGPKEYKDATIVVPEYIQDVPDEIVKEILKCKDCGKNYKIIPIELQFLKRINLPVPNKCPLCRDRTRILQLNSIQIYKRKCAKCKSDIDTSYGPDRPEIVYCEQCYQQEVA